MKAHLWISGLNNPQPMTAMSSHLPVGVVHGKAGVNMNKIPNSQLIITDLPSRRAAWKNILPFAHSFNGYEHCGSVQKCRDIARQGVAMHKAKQGLTQSLTDLRTCLFFEARRWKNLEKAPTKSGFVYIRALLEAIRVRVQANELV
jgi:hypothetical protein